MFAEPDLLTPNSQREQFAERFDRWLQNLRQQQLRLFSSCTSRVANVENDKEPDPGHQPLPEPEAQPEQEPNSDSEPEKVAEAEPDAGAGAEIDVRIS